MKKQQDPQLSTLRSELSTLQSEFRLLQQEWVETHRKLLNTLRSINRGGGKKAPEAPQVPAEAVPPALDPITAAIFARRNKNGVLDERLKASRGG